MTAAADDDDAEKVTARAVDEAEAVLRRHGVAGCVVASTEHAHSWGMHLPGGEDSPLQLIGDSEVRVDLDKPRLRETVMLLVGARDGAKVCVTVLDHLLACVKQSMKSAADEAAASKSDFDN